MSEKWYLENRPLFILFVKVRLGRLGRAFVETPAVACAAAIVLAECVVEARNASTCLVLTAITALCSKKPERIRGGVWRKKIPSCAATG